MNLTSRLAIFLIANSIGFFSASLAYTIAAYLGAPLLLDPELDPAFVKLLLLRVMMTWVACALFSIPGLFLKDRATLLLLLAPAVIPLGYGLKLFLSS